MVSVLTGERLEEAHERAIAISVMSARLRKTRDWLKVECHR